MDLKCLEEMEKLRKSCRSLNGEVNGKFKKKLARVIDIVTTLIYKAEASGDPDALREKNASFKIEIEKLKVDDIRRQREVKEMKALTEALKKEMLELRDRLDEVEQERERERGR